MMHGLVWRLVERAHYGLTLLAIAVLRGPDTSRADDGWDH